MVHSKTPQSIVIPQAAYCQQNTQPLANAMQVRAHNPFLHRSPNSVSAFEPKKTSHVQVQSIAPQPQFSAFPVAAPFASTSVPHSFQSRPAPVNMQPEQQQPSMSYVVRVGARGKTMHMCAFNGCQKSFSKPSALKRHIRTHTGERPFVCSEANCRRRFAERGNLKRHMRVHTGERPFACHHDGCLRKFARMRHLMAHIRSQHSSSSPVTSTPNTVVNVQKRADSPIVDESSSVSSGGISYRKKNPLNSSVDMSIEDSQYLKSKISSDEEVEMSEKAQSL